MMGMFADDGYAIVLDNHWNTNDYNTGVLRTSDRMQIRCGTSRTKTQRFDFVVLFKYLSFKQTHCL